MKEYKVRWEIEVSADSPREAAEEAYRIHRDSDSIAGVFYVFDRRGKKTKIDLNEPYKSRGKPKRRS